MKRNENNPFGPTAYFLNDFKKWIKSQGEEDGSTKKNIIGLNVESKISLKKLISKIESEENDQEIYEMAKHFKRSGGIILEVRDQNFIIEVESGNFQLPKIYVKKKN